MFTEVSKIGLQTENVSRDLLTSLEGTGYINATFEHDPFSDVVF